MYYSGSPFEPVNVITAEAAGKTAMYFKEKAEKPAFAGKVIETFTNGKIDLVIYVNAKSADTSLANYHRQTYGAQMPFFVEEYVGPRTIYRTEFTDKGFNGFTIFHFDENWRLKTEQALDKHYQPLEYREMFYKGGEQTPFEEKIFFARSWRISTEVYK